MTVKRILLLIILILVILAGGYITYFGINGYFKYSGRERDFNSLKGGDLHDDMLVKGEIPAVTAKLGKTSIDNDVFGIPVSKASAWHYYVYPLEYDNDITKRKYCVFAVSMPKDIAAADALITDKPDAVDPNKPRFEFRGIVIDINYDVHAKLTQYLWNIYDTDFNIHAHANVSRYIEPYTIYVRTDGAGGIKPIIIGAAMVLAGGVLLIVLCVATYRKNHRF